MASNNRAALINKVLKTAKKHFQPVEIPTDRSLLDHLIFACLAENSPYDVANEVFESLSADYYDWNEVRVTSIRELTEVMKRLNDPESAATRLKRVLQSVFETHYSFDLELMKKQNIGQTVKQMEKYNGATNYIVAFVTQNALGGHAIPINRGLLESMRVVGVISDSEAAKGTVPGLERVVPKSKGTEVGTILHQLGVELHRSPYGPTIRKLLLEIDPGCKNNLPKRKTKKPEPVVEEAPPEKPAKGKSTTKTAAANSSKKTASEPGASAKKLSTKKVAKKKTTAKPTTKKKTVKKVKKKVATKSKATPTKKKKAPPKKKTKSPSKGKKRKSVTKKLSKRKPK